MAEGPTVAVIGLGASGIVTLKNLSEEGFQVTGFDRNAYVGGLWKYTEEDKTSVMQSTVANVSKQKSCFTDFPFSQARNHPTASEIEEYLESYVSHFNLKQYMRLNTVIRHIRFDEEREQWAMEIEGQQTPEYFDKAVIANGNPNSAPLIPSIEGVEKFEGRCTHSRAFKKLEAVKGKRVLVVGFRNTAADTATGLAGVASEVYLSHRHGSYILPRRVDGKPADHGLSYRMWSMQDFLGYYFPDLMEKMFNNFVRKFQDKYFTVRPEWRFQPAPSMRQGVPIVSDTLISCLEKGTVKSVHGLKRFIGGNEVELDDGQRLDIDEVIWCTGYNYDFSFLEKKYDPTLHTTPRWAASIGSNGKPLPRMYQNLLSLEKPDSLAFMGNTVTQLGAFFTFDVASMAIAQIWKGASQLPPIEEMIKAVDEHEEYMCWLAQRGSVYPGMLKPQWVRWADEMAGSGVVENFGFGWKGWMFWLRDRAFCSLAMSCVFSPHIFRLFDGKRKRWDGAREAIIQASNVSKEKTL